MNASYRQQKRDLRSPIEKLAARIHLHEFPEEYDHTQDSIADAKARRNGENPMRANYIDRTNINRSLRGVTPLDAAGKPTDNSSQQWALKKATRDFTVKLDNALFNNDPMGTGCVQNYCTDEYERIALGIVERITTQNEELHHAILNELTAWFDQELADRPKVQRAVMAVLTDLI